VATRTYGRTGVRGGSRVERDLGKLLLAVLLIVSVPWVSLNLVTTYHIGTYRSSLNSLATKFGIERLFGITGDGYLAIAIAGTFLRFLNYFAESLSVT
jgi:glucuronate isomerase